MLRTKLFAKKSNGAGLRSEFERVQRMIVREIVTTCSNPHVARAAVISIGGDFARRFERVAATRNLSSGMLASRLVGRFTRRAEDSDWEGVREATRNAETPILSGLRYLLERGLEIDEDDEEPSPDGWSAPAVARSCRQASQSCQA